MLLKFKLKREKKKTNNVGESDDGRESTGRFTLPPTRSKIQGPPAIHPHNCVLYLTMKLHGFYRLLTKHITTFAQLRHNPVLFMCVYVGR